MRVILKQNKVLKKTHLHDPALPFRRRVKNMLPVGGIWALGGTREKVPRAWTRGIFASMTPPSIGTAQPAPRELPDTRYDFHFPGLTWGEWEWRKTACLTRRHRLKNWEGLFHKQSVLGLWQMLKGALSEFVPCLSQRLVTTGGKKVGITQIFQTHICTLCTFHALRKGRKC